MPTKSISKWLIASRRRLWRAWMSVQVEFQGQYSIERLWNLDTYTQRTSYVHTIAVCLLTPLPSLLMAVLVECVPLAPPQDGVYANWIFFFRVWFVSCGVIGSMTVQIGQSAPRLEMKTRHFVLTGLIAGVTAAFAFFGLAAAFVFPLPFGLLISSQPSIGAVFAYWKYLWGARWKADPLMQAEVKQQMSVLGCQLSLTMIYPVYFYVFVSLTGIHHILFIAVLPVIKLAAKNGISRALGDSNDVKPEEVTFNVEIFNALYLANSLRSASSLGATVTIMVIDLMHFWISMLDVVDILKDIKKLMKKIPESSIVGNDNFLQVAVRLLQTDSDSNAPSGYIAGPGLGKRTIEAWASTESSIPSTPKRQAAKVKLISFGHRIRPKVSPMVSQVAVHSQAGRDLNLQEVFNAGPSMDVPHRSEVIFSRADRAVFIHKTARVLFMIEYLVLTEFIEVILPIIYGLFHVIVFHLPNRDYYSSLANTSYDDLLSSTLNVVSYGALEFVSLLVFMLVVKRILGFSSLKQLAFVLEKQVVMVQTKIVILFMYLMSVSLAHYGSDLSFKFAWIHSRKNDG